ncbi:MAG TPA: aminotransferase class III-fold pyridoxal phosphate-dependent enzyme, partial [Actinomycetota bacterium]|nr:aminotransferase class III-fold pyridoxal phosphate-dependent enzyme [Actinomycetota bacterium]
MPASDLIAMLAAQAPPDLTSVALHPTGEAALHAAIAAAGPGAVATLSHPATPIPGALRAHSPYCFRCPLGLSFPSCEIACLDSLASIVDTGDVAAVVIEPAAQVPGGMITAPPGHLRRVRDLCDTHGAALIADERFTGAGAGGFFWAFTRDG